MPSVATIRTTEGPITVELFDEDAPQTVANFKGQVDAMKGMVDKLDFTADGADVKLSAAASNAKLQSLFKMFAGGGM